VTSGCGLPNLAHTLPSTSGLPRSASIKSQRADAIPTPATGLAIDDFLSYSPTRQRARKLHVQQIDAPIYNLHSDSPATYQGEKLHRR